MNSHSQLARCYLCAWGSTDTAVFEKKKVSTSFSGINKLCGVNHTLPRLLEELNKVLTLGKHMTHDSSSSQAFLWNSGKNVRAIFGEKKEIRSFFWFGFSLNRSQHRGYTTLPLSHLFSTSPPATHFNLINDPSPTTRLCFYRLLLKVDLLWSVSLQFPTILWCSWLTAVLYQLFGIQYLRLLYIY